MYYEEGRWHRVASQLADRERARGPDLLLRLPGKTELATAALGTHYSYHHQKPAVGAASARSRLPRLLEKLDPFDQHGPEDETRRYYSR